MRNKIIFIVFMFLVAFGLVSSPAQAAPSYSLSPVFVSHNVPVPPVPVVRAIRAARHPEASPKFDRIVFDFSGRIPSYSVLYVTTPINDATGKRIAVSGNYFLRVRFRPAQAHTTGGLLFPSSKFYGFPELRSYRVGGDFEGVVTIYLGLQNKRGFIVKELANPNRVYIDIRY